MLDFLTVLLPKTPEQWAIALSTGLTVATSLQLFGHFTGLKAENKDARKLLTFLAAVFSFVAAWADKFLFYANGNPKLIIALNLGWVVAFATWWHRFAIGPIYHWFMDYKNGIHADAMAYRNEKAAALAAAANPSEPQYANSPEQS